MKGDYEKSDLKFKAFTSIPPDKREAIIEETPHLIVTHKLLGNILEFLDDIPYALIYDEAHIFGDVLAEAFRFQLRNCPVRIGLSGSFPKKNRFKFQRIKAHMGGDVLYYVPPSELETKGYASKTHIEVYTTEHPEMEEFSKTKYWDWEQEAEYLNKHRGRIEAIAQFIKDRHAMDPVNTMILSKPETAVLLGEKLDGHHITDDVAVKDREALLARFDTEDNFILPCTFGTIGTGVSKSNIQRMYLIDVGSVEHWIIQGIGRGARLDGKDNLSEVIDISASTKYSKKHRGTRMTLYKNLKYDFKKIKDTIQVKEIIE